MPDCEAKYRILLKSQQRAIALLSEALRAAEDELLTGWLDEDTQTDAKPDALPHAATTGGGTQDERGVGAGMRSVGR